MGKLPGQRLDLSHGRDNTASLTARPLGNPDTCECLSFSLQTSQWVWQVHFLNGITAISQNLGSGFIPPQKSSAICISTAKFHTHTHTHTHTHMHTHTCTHTVTILASALRHQSKTLNSVPQSNQGAGPAWPQQHRRPAPGRAGRALRAVLTSHSPPHTGAAHSLQRAEALPPTVHKASHTAGVQSSARMQTGKKGSRAARCLLTSPQSTRGWAEARRQPQLKPSCLDAGGAK